MLYFAPPKVGGGFEWEAEKGALCGEHGWLFAHLLKAVVPAPAPRQLLYVLLKIGCFALGAWACFRRGYFWKI